jgi:hypothetical protein
LALGKEHEEEAFHRDTFSLTRRPVAFERAIWETNR